MTASEGVTRHRHFFIRIFSSSALPDGSVLARIPSQRACAARRTRLVGVMEGSGAHRRGVIVSLRGTERALRNTPATAGAQRRYAASPRMVIHRAR